MARKSLRIWLSCLGFTIFCANPDCQANWEEKKIDDYQFERDTLKFDSQIETERKVNIALLSLRELIASNRLKFFGPDPSQPISMKGVLTASLCEKLVTPVTDKLKTPEELISFAAVCRTKSSLYGRYGSDGVGMFYEAAYCTALENLAKHPSAKSVVLMEKLPEMFHYDGASSLFFGEKLDLLRSRVRSGATPSNLPSKNRSPQKNSSSR